MAFTLHISVKFRAFGITFGTFDKYGDVLINPVNKSVTIQRVYDGGSVPVGAKVVFNDRGVLLQVWPQN